MKSIMQNLYVCTTQLAVRFSMIDRREIDFEYFGY